MINIEELLYDIDLKLNKIGSNEHQNFELENKIIALNDAHINVIKTKFSENKLSVLKANLISDNVRDLFLVSFLFHSLRQ